MLWYLHFCFPNFSASLIFFLSSSIRLPHLRTDFNRLRWIIAGNSGKFGHVLWTNKNAGNRLDLFDPTFNHWNGCRFAIRKWITSYFHADVVPYFYLGGPLRLFVMMEIKLFEQVDSRRKNMRQNTKENWVSTFFSRDAAIHSFIHSCRPCPNLHDTIKYICCEWIGGIDRSLWMRTACEIDERVWEWPNAIFVPHVLYDLSRCERSSADGIRYASFVIKPCHTRFAHPSKMYNTHQQHVNEFRLIVLVIRDRNLWLDCILAAHGLATRIFVSIGCFGCVRSQNRNFYRKRLDETIDLFGDEEEKKDVSTRIYHRLDTLNALSNETNKISRRKLKWQKWFGWMFRSGNVNSNSMHASQNQLNEIITIARWIWIWSTGLYIRSSFCKGLTEISSREFPFSIRFSAKAPNRKGILMKSYFSTSITSPISRLRCDFHPENVFTHWQTRSAFTFRENWTEPIICFEKKSIENVIL